MGLPLRVSALSLGSCCSCCRMPVRSVMSLWERSRHITWELSRTLGLLLTLVLALLMDCLARETLELVMRLLMWL